MRSRERAAALALALLTPAAAVAEPPHSGGIFDAGELGSRKEPITVTSDTLEYDYKANVVVYRGEVVATQGVMKVRSDTLTVTFDTDGRDQGAKTSPIPSDTTGSHKLRDIVAVGGVRIDNGTRWATGGRAVFEQGHRTVVLTENPVMHDGQNEVAGDRVVVYLDEDRSIVEGGRKRVKAVLYPGKNEGLMPAGGDGPRAPGDAGTTAKAGTP